MEKNNDIETASRITDLNKDIKYLKSFIEQVLANPEHLCAAEFVLVDEEALKKDTAKSNDILTGFMNFLKQREDPVQKIQMSLPNKMMITFLQMVLDKHTEELSKLLKDIKL